MASDSNGEEDLNRSMKTKFLARGGPIYFPNTLGTLLHPLAFKNHLLYELEALKAELTVDSSQEVAAEDLSVDELKVYTDEELVDRALNEALEGEQEGDASKQYPESLNRKRSSRTLLENAEEDGNFPAPSDSTTVSFVKAVSNGIKPKSTLSRRRKQSKENREKHLAKVDELVKIKEKQDKDRDLAKMFLKSLRKNDGAFPMAEGFERISALMSSDSVRKHPNISEYHEKVAVLLPEILLCVEVMENKCGGEKTQELIVLGCQRLTDMKDLIDCRTEKIMKKDNLYNPSGYFLIEDMFYNDLRDQTAIDYSEPILSWLQNSKNDALEKWTCIVSGDLKKKQKEVVGDVATPQLPLFKRAKMHETRFCDLKFRLGAGYLYCHQGDCKHTIVFRDMRMIHPEDLQNGTAYPMVFQRRSRILKCHVCGIHKATKVTLNDKWAKFNPCYFCDGCYFYLHYTEDGSLLYSDFSVYECS